jgi:hypothetical protein
MKSSLNRHDRKEIDRRDAGLERIGDAEKVANVAGDR